MGPRSATTGCERSMPRGGAPSGSCVGADHDGSPQPAPQGARAAASLGRAARALERGWGAYAPRRAAGHGQPPTVATWRGASSIVPSRLGPCHRLRAKRGDSIAQLAPSTHRSSTAKAAAVSQQDSLYEYRRYLFWLRLRRGGIAGNDYEAENGDPPPRRSRSPPLSSSYRRALSKPPEELFAFDL